MAGVDRANNSEDINFDAKIVVAEDSPFLNKLIVDAVSNAGFHNVTSFANGKET